MKLLKNARVLGYHEIIENKETRKLIQKLTGDDYRAKCECVEKDCGLDILIKDKDWRIRAAVAKRGYRLDALINDENAMVRAVVAQQGYGLDRLIHDISANVRASVAGQGYGLDVLAHDREGYVLRAVYKYMGAIPPMSTSGSMQPAVV